MVNDLNYTIIFKYYQIKFFFIMGSVPPTYFFFSATLMDTQLDEKTDLEDYKEVFIASIAIVCC